MPQASICGACCAFSPCITERCSRSFWLFTFPGGFIRWFRSTLGGWLVYVVYLENWYILHNDQIWRGNLLGHFWSLAVEEQFYLIWPWIVWNVRAKTVIRISLLAIAGSLVLRYGMMWHLGPQYSIYELFLTPTRWDGLFIGAAIAAYSSEHGCVSRRATALMAATGALILAVILLLNPRAFLPGVGVQVYTIGFTGIALVAGALIGVAQHSVPGLTAFLNQPWLRSMGKYSYGMYVYHVWIFLASLHFASQKGLTVFTRTRYALLFLLIDIPLSYGIAVLSYKFYESRFLRLKNRFGAGVPRRT